MENFEVIWKEVGQTPLQALEIFRDTKPEFKDSPMTYAGRLDPMAEGKLIILIGEECKNRAFYTNLNKVYEFEVLLGACSDTGDILGLVDLGPSVPKVEESKIIEILPSLLGRHDWEYPAYSSKTINGKPMFQYALEGELQGVNVPRAHANILEISFLGRNVIKKTDLFQDVVRRLSKLIVPKETGQLGANFRKPDILARWQSVQENLPEELVSLKFVVKVGAGTYVRTLAQVIAEKLGTVGLAYSIKRTKIFKIPGK